MIGMKISILSLKAPELYLHMSGPGNFKWLQWQFQTLSETGEQGQGFMDVLFLSVAAFGL